ncbi:Alpha-1,2-fucosyltransferase-like protein [Candidatus Planktophila versatilis]|uniref:Alpha-1,2-fucosyltransferase-like protein n=1 Tax=Candidatus Planktophila versatilis TaxID=1884905 RepID=A0AAD0E682_9ACTN|nr:alpha-1,2-fucosyltransferase [Candidatus Planktophila versatilis]ASY22059.1 Alpha-1,2-fucosyltransferase-like protein [Candidatus Planktophila versatilis]
MENRVILSGGLGNQIFQYVAGRVIFDQSQIILDYSLLNPRLLKNGLPEIADLMLSKNVTWECPKRSLLQRKLAELILKGSSIRADHSVRRRALIKIFPYFCLLVGHLFFKGSKILAPRGIGYSEISISRHKSHLLIGNFHSYSWFEKNPSQFRGELSLQIGLEGIEAFRLASRIERPLVVQMRFGDFLDIEELNVITRDYFANSLTLARSRSPNSKVWIFSNDFEKARDYLGEAYSDEFKEINPKGFTSAQILELLKLGTGYIISNSTFGWWGAYMTQTPHSLVCVPANWYATMITPRNLIPSSWERIPLGQRNDD